MKRVSLFSFIGLSLVACRGGGGGGGDDVDAPTQIHIQDVQNAAMPKGTPVSLKGVVVTAIDTFGARTGDLWVEEPGGGEFSGIKIFGAPLDVVANLKAGDIVDITNAEKDEFALTSDMSGRTATELKGAGGGQMQMTKTGSGNVPAPAMVDALAISKLGTPAERDAEWEKWEGVLINVINARQESAVGTFGTNPDQKSFKATGGLVVETVLADFPAVSLPGVCYSGMSGIGDYFFDYLLLPRAPGDLTDGGNGCAAQVATTVSAIQAGTVTGSVKLDNVFVTARSVTIQKINNVNTIVDGRTLWVSDSLTGAQNNSIAVFFGAAADPAFTVGSKINLLGSTQEFDVGMPKAGDTLTEIVTPAGTLVTAAGAAPTPMAVTVDQVNDITTGEPFEGTLVQLTNVKVTAVDATHNQVTLTDNNGKSVSMDDDVFVGYNGTLGAATLPAVNDCFTKLVGIMSVQLTDNVRTVNPRNAADMTKGAGCN